MNCQSCLIQDRLAEIVIYTNKWTKRRELFYHFFLKTASAKVEMGAGQICGICLTGSSFNVNLTVVYAVRQEGYHAKPVRPREADSTA